MGALAGSALIAQNKPSQALDEALDRALLDAEHDAVLIGAIEQDRATALVALSRPAEASHSAGEGRAAPRPTIRTPGCSRPRCHGVRTISPQLEAQIEKAATLAPDDPAVGLEAGVIAALGGRDDAARKSFESVISLALQTANRRKRPRAIWSS